MSTDATPETPEEPVESESKESAGSIIGYAVAVLLAIGGAFYFFSTLEVVFLGASGQNALGAVFSTVVATAFFGAATVVMVGTYIYFDSP